MTRDIGVGSNTSSIRAAHLDEDGFIDLVVGNNNGTTSAIYLNDQSGGFSDDARMDLVGNNMTNAIEIGDLNQDHRPDIVLCNGNPQFNSVHLSDGAGGILHSFKLSRFDQDTRGATIGDFDTDGFADIVLGNWKKGVEFWAGDGSGLNFELAQRLEDGSRPQESVAYQQRASDVALLGDQYPDAFVAHSDSSVHTINEIMLNRPWRQFDVSQRYEFGFFMDGGQSRRLLSHDLTGDGVDEVVVINTKSLVVWSSDLSGSVNR